MRLAEIRSLVPAMESEMTRCQGRGVNLVLRNSIEEMEILEHITHGTCELESGLAFLRRIIE